MISRRSVLIAPAGAVTASALKMKICLHQTTSAAAGYRRSLEGYAKAGIKYVEIIPPHLEEFARKEGLPAARRLLSDLGLTAVSSGDVRGLAEPNPNRAKALDDLKAKAAMIAELGIDHGMSMRLH